MTYALETLIAASCVLGVLIGLCIGYFMAYLKYAPKIEEQEEYRVPDPRMVEINKQISDARAKHKPVSHLIKRRMEICHEGLRQ